MKTNFLSKAKWYMVGFILVAIMLSVSLSFSAWDTLSAKASLSGGSGRYEKKYALADDKNNNKIADVGDIVEYGNYYQDIDENGELFPKTPIRWIVVDKVNDVLTLYSEKILAYGSFFGTWYIPEDGNRVHGMNFWANSNYTESNIRKWLNSDTTLRGDKGPSFSPTSNDRVTFRGFYSEAFSDFEKSNILNKRIYDMAGYGFADGVTFPTLGAYKECNDKVWIPSISEMLGNNAIVWQEGLSDGKPNAQFQYFVDGNSVNAERTEFSYSKHSNYTMPEVVHQANFSNGAFWLRSTGGAGAAWTIVFSNPSSRATQDSYSGIRPAINIPIN